MKVSPLGIPDVKVIEASPVGDARGWFARLYCPDQFAELGLNFRPCQISVSHNAAAGTLRGLHFQRPPAAEAKLVRCLKGAVWDVAVDIRPDSPTLRQWTSAELTPENGRAILLPKGFAHGFITLMPETELLYMTDHPWTREAEDGMRWNDPSLGINWPLQPEVLSNRDRGFALIDGPDG